MEFTVNRNIIKDLGAKLYQDYALAVIRESVQNSLDAGATRLDVFIPYSNYTEFSIADNGNGISDLNILMEVGGSDKPLENSVGGYGIAKFVFFSADFFSVRSGNQEFVWNDNSAEIREHSTYYKGTLLTLRWNQPKYLRETVYWYLRLLKTNKPDLTIVLNDEEILPFSKITHELIGETFIRRIHSPGDFSKLWVCLNGQPQFYHSLYLDTADWWVLDLTTDKAPYEDGYPLAATREKLLGEYSNLVPELSMVIRRNDQRVRVALQKRENALHVWNEVLFAGDVNLSEKETENLKEGYRRAKRIFNKVLRKVGLKPIRLALKDMNDAYACLVKSNDEEPFVALSIKDLWSREGFLVAIFLHELAHLKEEWHNESFAGELTRLFSEYLD